MEPRIKRVLVCITIVLSSYRIFAGTYFDNDPKPDSSIKKIMKRLQVQTYEDNMFGYTSDSDDAPFIDVKLSLQARLYPFEYLMNMMSKKYKQNIHLNIAFTGRFGQYKSTRYSSPVVEKRLNPVLFLEVNPAKSFQNTMFQLGYGHESDGQVLDDSVSFFKTADLSHNTVDQTKDRISRGWDYVAVSMVTNYFPKKWARWVFETDLTLKYYLDYGVLQGRKEEYYSWERDWDGANYSRNDVSGISFAFTGMVNSSFINKIRIGYETGIARPFFNNSVNLLLGFKIGKLPLAISYRYGYAGDLAQFGKLNQSVGIAYILTSFNRPDDNRKH